MREILKIYKRFFYGQEQIKWGEILDKLKDSILEIRNSL